MKTNRSRSAPRQCPRIAVVGCGAAAKEFYLPVLRKYDGFRHSLVLVDQLRSQAAAVASEFGIEHICTDYRTLPMDVDAAIITTPHNLHAEQSIHFLTQGRHVFVEKPLAMTATEVSQVLDAAAAGKAVLMVNNYRRLFPSYVRVKELLQTGQLGSVRRIVVHDGTEFAWNSASSFYLRDPRVRGVFLDRGAHTVDILCWWLGQRPSVVQARHDAREGVEGLMDVRLAHREAVIDLKFSRFYRLENRYCIEGDNAQIEGRLFDFSRLCVRREGRAEWITAGKPRPHNEYAWQLVHNFMGTIQGRESPLFLAAEVAPSLAVIDEAYRIAVPLEMPWYEQDPNLAFLKQDFQLTHRPELRNKT
jgi:predicted dehydrogenase